MKAVLIAFLLLVFGAVVLAASEAERPNGLMWNRTGLPLVFPLNVKSAPGLDYYMVLKGADDNPALAAYVRGGEFFRVLVPPGLFQISFAAGTSWQGQEELFGKEETQFFSLANPLEFAILDASTKGGHSIDLTDLASLGVSGITVAETYICQGTVSSNAAKLAPPSPPDLDTNPVGQDILIRRFERGANVFEIYDRQRQQDDFDPPVLGAPRVPLARPQQDTGTGLPAQQATRVYERPC